MTFLDPKQSLINLTYAMSNKQKFAYINVPKASIVALSKNSENSFPNFFAKNVVTSLKANDKNIMKAVSHSLQSDIEANRHYKIGLHKGGEYYYSNIFEYYYLNDRDVISSISDFYIKYSKSAIVTFHDKKMAAKHFGHNIHVISIPYSNYYNKVDDVYAQLAELDGELDYCLLDCGVFGLGLLPKVWKNLNVSVIDLGKMLTLSKGHKQKVS